MTSTKLVLNNKIHTAVVEGQPGSCRDINGRWAATTCGTRNAKTRASFTDNDRAVTCKKCG